MTGPSYRTEAARNRNQPDTDQLVEKEKIMKELTAPMITDHGQSNAQK